MLKLCATHRSSPGPASPAERPGIRAGKIALTIAAAGCVLAAAACAGPAAPRPAGHGLVVAHLPIPFRPAVPAGKPDVVRITVQVGQRFSIKIDTSDGPYYWAQAGAGPDPRLVRPAGDINAGSCAPGLVGCRVPYFHTLVARASGTTTMTWKYHAPLCQHAPSAATPRPFCPAVTTVMFDITVR